jgi:hypothetical protein
MAKKTSKKTLERKADSEWGLAVRTRDKMCRLCNRRLTINAHHVIKRRNKETRLLLSNGIGTCFFCHKYVEALATLDWTSPFPRDDSDYAKCMVSIIGKELWDELQSLKDANFKYNELYIEEAIKNIRNSA